MTVRPIAPRPHHAKACFDELYVQPDPRAYYKGLGSLGYEIPQHGQRVFQRVLDALGISQPVAIDLCCSYGVNAALLKHDLDLDDLYRHYGTEQLAEVLPETLVEIDRRYFAARRRDHVPYVVGVDSATPAVEYAERVGLLDVGLAENLEVTEPSPDLRVAAAHADLITVTGGVGYITERTFDRLLGCVEGAVLPWVASLCLRTVSYEPVAECLAGHGLVTEQLAGVTFPQRRFDSAEERDFALEQLALLGVDPTGKESEGWYHVDVYLSRPADEAAAAPLAEVLGEVAGCVAD
jgi:hypothetical protein